MGNALLNGMPTYQVSIRVSADEKKRLEKLKALRYLSAHAILVSGIEVMEKDKSKCK